VEPIRRDRETKIERSSVRSGWGITEGVKFYIWDIQRQVGPAGDTNNWESL
jgi:hypothetical protein